MPGPINSGRIYQTAIDPMQIASSNATIQTLFGRQRSWMTGGAGVSNSTVHKQLLPRGEILDKRNTHVLPSPAPSDEPSPAISNSLDSPNQQTVSLVESTIMAPAAGSPNYAVTEARFVSNGRPPSTTPLRPNDQHRRGLGGSSSGTPVQRTVELPAQGAADLAAFSPVMTNFHQTPQTTSSFTSPHPAVAQTVAQTVAQSPTSALNTAGTQEVNGAQEQHRMEGSERIKLSFSSFVSTVDDWLVQSGGIHALSAHLEGPRLQLLRLACVLEDGMFIALHQLFCIWSLDHELAASYLIPIPPVVTDNAFYLVERILEVNQNMSEKQWSWFREFPAPIEQLAQLTDYALAIQNAAIFLQKLPKNYPPLICQVMSRNYPLLVDELLAYFDCCSPCLQRIMFVCSRRTLGVPDGQAASRIEEAFHQDQRNHRDEQTGPFRLPQFPPGTNIGQMICDCNASLIGFYQSCVKQAKPVSQASEAMSVAPAVSQGPTIAASPPTFSNSLHPPSMSQLGPTIVQPTTTLNDERRPSYTTAPFPPRQSPNLVQNGFAPNAQHFSPQPPPQAVLRSNIIYTQPDSPSIAAPMPTPNTQSYQNTTQHSLQQFGQLEQQMSPNMHNAQVLAEQQRQHIMRMQSLQLLQQGNSQHQLQQSQQLHWPGNNGANPVQQARQRMSPAMQSSQFPAQPSHSPFISPLGSPGMQTTFHNNSQPTYMARQIPLTQMTPNIQRQTIRNMQGNPQATHAVRQTASEAKESIIPPTGYMIPRPEWPTNPSEDKAISMALHQADVRSPKRTLREENASSASKPERYYQYPQACLVGPISVPSADRVYKFSFQLSMEQMLSIIGPQSTTELIPTMLYFNGAVRWRLRCAALPMPSPPSSVPVPTPEQWSTMETFWPMNIYMSLNGNPLTIRRHAHNGKDLPTELTSYVNVGENVLQVSIPQNRRENNMGFFLAVEEVVTLNHTTIMEKVTTNQVHPEESTIQAIRERLSGSGAGDDDGEIIFQASDLSVDLADPFSKTVFRIPARGAACTHIECFDLETWLDTRPAKPTRRCHHKVSCECPKRQEPSHPDKWKCPICDKDARPCSLRIDSFLVDVRRKLEEDNQLSAKRMNVGADGTWTAVVEAETPEDSDDDDEPIRKRMKRGRVPASAPEVSKKKTAIEVIILDDD